MLHDRDVIDERYEQLRECRRRIERFVIRCIALALVAMAVVSSVAALQVGSETFDGTRLVERGLAGGFAYVTVAAISCVMMALVWFWPRPRSLVFFGLIWVVGAFALLFSFSPRHWAEPQAYSYVTHHTALKVADLLMSLTVVAWFAVPIIALSYGIICVVVDDHVRRKLPPAPEFPVARIRTP